MTYVMYSTHLPKIFYRDIYPAHLENDFLYTHLAKNYMIRSL